MLFRSAGILLEWGGFRTRVQPIENTGPGIGSGTGSREVGGEIRWFIQTLPVSECEIHRRHANESSGGEVGIASGVAYIFGTDDCGIERVAGREVVLPLIDRLVVDVRIEFGDLAGIRLVVRITRVVFRSAVPSRLS